MRDRFNRHTVLVPLALWILLSLAGPPALAIDDTGLLEDTFFHRTYAMDPPEVRLARLEQFLFGDEKPGPLQDRYSLLIQTAVENKVALDSRPVEDSDTDPRMRQPQFLQGLPPEAQGASVPTDFPEAMAPDATAYPTVTAMEMRTFKQSYEQDPIQTRLERLETHVFKHPFPEKALADRVDQLTLRVLPEDPLSQEIRLNGLPPQAAAAAWGATRALPNTSTQMASQNLAIYGQLSSLELKILGISYGGESLTTRLNRLEGRMFGQFQAGSIDDRFARIRDQASGTSGYTPGGGYGQAMPPAQGAITIPRWPPENHYNPSAAYIPYSTPTGAYSRRNVPVAAGVQPLRGSETPQVLEQVSHLELDVFGRSFEMITLSNRIANLEIKTLNQTFPGLLLDERLAQITRQVSGQQQRAPY